MVSQGLAKNLEKLMIQPKIQVDENRHVTISSMEIMKKEERMVK